MKCKAQRAVPILLFVLIFGFCAYGVFYLYIGGRPTPATAEQVEAALNAQGFPSQNITDSAQDHFPGFGLESCIVAEQNDIRFEFYRFNNVDSAKKVYQQAHSKIIGNRTSRRVEFEERKFNYHVYILDIETNYYLAMYAENTAIYTDCTPAENSGKINWVLDSLGYIDASGEDWHTKSPLDGMMRVAVFALWIPVMYLVRFWIWPVLCKSAGVTRKEAPELGDSRKEMIPKLIRRSKTPKQAKIFAAIHDYISLPAYIAVAIALVGCFTDKVDSMLGALGLALPIIMVCCVILFMIISKVMGSSWKRHG